MISLRDVVTGFGNRDPLAEVWRRSLRGGGGGAAEITGVPPLRYIGDGRPLTDYRIAGNTVQDGTPSPDAPVDATGCGAWDEAQQSYKLPLTVNGAEHPIYLGQVESTRRVKKLVLTGEETWGKDANFDDQDDYFYTDPIPNITRDEPPISSHFISGARNVINSVWIGGGPSSPRIALEISKLYTGIASTDDKATRIVKFKSYLAAQYAAGTPVTVWYVLATPETAVVNEPLMKIGDYADTISFAQAGVTIPTVNGENVLNVPTEVPPSQITIKGGISSV